MCHHTSSRKENFNNDDDDDSAALLHFSTSFACARQQKAGTKLGIPFGRERKRDANQISHQASLSPGIMAFASPLPAVAFLFDRKCLVKKKLGRIFCKIACSIA